MEIGLDALCKSLNQGDIINSMIFFRHESFVKTLVFIIISSIFFASNLFGAEITNLERSNIGSHIIFEFDVIGEKEEDEVYIFVAINIGGKVFSPDKLHIRGDLGKIKTGKGKKIYWNVLQDFPLGMPPNIEAVIVAAGKTFRDPATGMEFVFVKGGCYEMGDTFGDGETNERPVHEVCVDDFYMGKYEVTVKEFMKFVEDKDYETEAERGDGCSTFIDNKWQKDINANWRNPDFEQDETHPVVCVSWHDVNAFIDWLKGKTTIRYRLPTEAEREYAARSRGKKYKYSWGENPPSGNIADETAKMKFPSWTVWTGYHDGYVFTAPVGSYKPNELGLYDMTGNVWEWTLDWYATKYYAESPKNNPSGSASGENKVLRGGGWNNGPRGSRITFRGRFEPNARYNDIGFRLVFPAQ